MVARDDVGSAGGGAGCGSTPRCVASTPRARHGAAWAGLSALAACAAALVVCMGSLQTARASVIVRNQDNGCRDPPLEAQFCAPAFAGMPKSQGRYQMPLTAAGSAVALDAIAKSSYDSLLASVVNCREVFVTAECATKALAYVCASTFQACKAVKNNNTHSLLKRPCRSTCADFCAACFIDSCPCYDAVDAAAGDECFTLSDMATLKHTAKSTSGAAPGAAGAARAGLVAAMAAHGFVAAVAVAAAARALAPAGMLG